MKIGICQLTSEVTVVGARVSVRIGPGAQIDLDQVVGHGEGRAVTLEEALGPELLTRFTAPSAEEPKAEIAPASTRRPRGARGEEKE